MSNFGGYHSDMEKEARKRINQLNKSLNKVSNNIWKILYESGRNPKKTSAYWNKVRKDLNRQYKELNVIFESWAEKEIPLAYRKAIRKIQRKFEKTKTVTQSALSGSRDIIDSKYSIEIMRSLYAKAVTDFKNATYNGLKNTHKWTRQTQQLLLSESEIDLTIANIFNKSGDLTKSAKILSDQLYKKLSKSMSDNHFIQAGKRKFKVNYYAELVARVKFHEAHSYGALTQAKNYETDLVIVSTHNTKTALCQEFEGKIYSIEGKDKRFPRLSFTPPFHPNCLHLILPTFESSMEIQGTLEDFAKFSNNKSEVPPVPAGFIPLGERG